MKKNVCLWLENDLMDSVRKVTKRKGYMLSAWIAENLRSGLERESAEDKWRESYVENENYKHV